MLYLVLSLTIAQCKVGELKSQVKGCTLTFHAVLIAWHINLGLALFDCRSYPCCMTIDWTCLFAPLLHFLSVAGSGFR